MSSADVYEIADLQTEFFGFSAHGFEMVGLSEEDSYVRYIRENEPPEPLLVNFLRSQFDPDGEYVIADVGANIGFTSLLMSRCLPKAVIHAFEPGKTIHELLGRNTKDRKIVPVNSAVSNAEGTVAFQESSAYGHIILNGDGASVPYDISCEICQGKRHQEIRLCQSRC